MKKIKKSEMYLCLIDAIHELHLWFEHLLGCPVATSNIIKRVEDLIEKLKKDLNLIECQENYDD